MKHGTNRGQRERAQRGGCQRGQHVEDGARNVEPKSAGGGDVGKRVRSAINGGVRDDDKLVDDNERK